MIQEVKTLNLPKIEKAVSDLLEGIGEDPQREGLVETPKRVAKAYAELFAGLNHQATDFTDYKIFHVDEEPEMVLVQKIPFYSVCEHHLLPFLVTSTSLTSLRMAKSLGLAKFPGWLTLLLNGPECKKK